MINNRRIVALIPLRGGSKSIPKKNIKLIAGKPLCAWVLEVAHAVPEINEVYVSTDDNEISNVVNSLNLGVKILKRPPELATDYATTESVMIHFAENVTFDILITLQATSPLTTPDDVRRGLKLYFTKNLDSLLTGVRVKSLFWTSDAKPVNYDFKKRPRRQELEGWFKENGAFYITDSQLLVNTGFRLGGKIGILEMPPETIIDIDEPEDWELVERILIRKKTGNFSESLKSIKLFAVDVDGTLTDAGMYYSKEGEFLKKFNTRDAKGLEILKKKGVIIAIITSEDSDIVRARMKKIQIQYVYCGEKDKLKILEKLGLQLKIKIKQMAFIGDDLNDLEVIKNVGFSACPLDAVDEVKKTVNYICKTKGGEGAVREVCELLLSSIES